MKDLLKSSLTIISECGVLFLAAIWYYNTKEIEPLIAIIISSVALLSSVISYFSKSKESQAKNFIGKSTEKFLHEDFLYNYVPGSITMSKIIKDLGKPIGKTTEFVERELNEKKEFSFYIYKYKFSNAVVLFTTDLNDENVISISLISKSDKNHPIKCRYSFAEEDKSFGEAVITENLIENIENFQNENYANWNYSAITARYGDYRPIKYLNFTYFIYNHYNDKSEMFNKEINGICISTMSDIKPVIHFDDYLFN
jgi:hypothetical protein